VIERLLQPFQRLASDHAGQDDQRGLGLGLSIAHAITTAHGASLVVRARSHGGLEITASFPASRALLLPPSSGAALPQVLAAPPSQRAPRS